MITKKYIFEEVSDVIFASKICAKCGNKINKKFTEYQTLNPWNKNSIERIHELNLEKLYKIKEEWESTSESCDKCINDDIPEIDFDMVTQKEWDDAQVLLSEIKELSKLLQDKIHSFQKLFKNRFAYFIHKKFKNPRIMKIEYISFDECDKQFYMSGDIVHTNKKEFLTQTTSELGVYRKKVFFEGSDENQIYEM